MTTRDDTANEDTREPILEHSFVRCILEPHGDTNPQTSDTNSAATDRDNSLFSLGIILIELALGKTIEDLRSSEKTTRDFNFQSRDFLDYTTALDCLGHVYSTQGAAYGGAVERCIKGLRFDEPIRQDLTDLLYKNEFQAQVVWVLEWNLEIGVRRTSPPPALLLTNGR